MSGVSERRRGQHLDPILREHLRARAELLRENSISNADIAAALGVSASTVIEWIGKQPPSARKPRTASPRTLRPRASRPFASDLGLDTAFDYHAALDHIETVDEPPGRAAETVLRDSADILAAIRDATGAAAIFDDATDAVRLRYLESDDVPWYDEPEPLLPPVPSNRWLASYATVARNIAEEAEARWVFNHRLRNR